MGRKGKNSNLPKIKVGGKVENKEGKRKNEIKGKECDDTGLSVEAPETSCVPWVWFKAVIRRVPKTVSPSREYFVDYEGALPFGFEFMLLLLGKS